MTCATVVARTDLTVICVGFAVDTLPAIHTDTLVRALVVHASRPVLTRLPNAFVHVLRAVLPCEQEGSVYVQYFPVSKRVQFMYSTSL